MGKAKKRNKLSLVFSIERSAKQRETLFLVRERPSSSISLKARERNRDRGRKRDNNGYMLTSMFTITRVAECCSVLRCVAVCCGVLQCVAACCSVLQRVA